MKRVMLCLILSLVLTSVFPGGMITVAAADQLQGKIKDVDTQEKSLVIGLKDQDKVVYLDQNAQILNGAQAVGIEALKVGMLVSIEAVLKEGELFAGKIVISN